MAVTTKQQLKAKLKAKFQIEPNGERTFTLRAGRQVILSGTVDPHLPFLDILLEEVETTINDAEIIPG